MNIRIMDKRSLASTNLTTTGSQLKLNDGSYARMGTDRVEERLRLDHLEKLLYWFQVHKPPPPRPPTPNEFVIALPPDKKLRRKSGLMTSSELQDTLASVLDTRSYDGQLENLFAKLDTSGDGYVDWGEFSTYLLLNMREMDFMRASKLIPFQHEAKIKHIINCRQDSTTRILSLTNPAKFVTISKEGIMNVWSPSLAQQYAYNLNEPGPLPLQGGSTYGGGTQRGPQGGDNRDDKGAGFGRRVREWITDAVYLWNCHRIAVTSTGRDIRFYDTTMASQFYEEYNLYGLPDVPTCLYYYYRKPRNEGVSGNPQDSEARALLVFGDDQGHIHILTFHRISSRLFSKPYRKEEGVQKVYFPQLHNDSAWTTHIRLDFHHVESIKKVLYLADNDYVAASTLSSRSSTVLIDVQGKKKSYSFHISKGVECFDYSRSLNVLVTGSSDHVVRIWNPYVTNKPIASLQGHALGIVDVMIYEPAAQVFSLSRDAVLRVWDIRDQTVVQTVLIKFQIGYLQRVPDYGSFPTHFYTGPNRSLLVAANDQIALLKLGQIKQVNTGQTQTHTAALCGAIYNPKFKQVITAAEDSSVGLWDLETGAKSLMFNNAHSGEQITSLSLDSTGKRLITGAINGSVKVWNVQNGHVLTQMEALDESEITGIIHVNDRKSFITVGWNRKIVQYPDTDSDAALIKGNTSWRAGQLHKEDILTVSYFPPNLLATGTFDGEIFIWFVETEALYKKLSHPLIIGDTKSKESNTSSSVNNNHCRNLSKTPSGNTLSKIDTNNAQENSKSSSKSSQEAAGDMIADLVTFETGQDSRLQMGLSEEKLEEGLEQQNSHNKQPNKENSEKLRICDNSEHIEEKDLLEGKENHRNSDNKTKRPNSEDIKIENMKNINNRNPDYQFQDSEKQKERFKIGDVEEREKMSRSNTGQTRSRRSVKSASRRMPAARQSKAPVDKLLFLNARIKVKRSDSAILISSEAGYLRWWNVFGSKQLYGYYYGASQPDESILCFASDSGNTLLVAGDTKGRIAVWNIEDYCKEYQNQVVTMEPYKQSDWLGHTGPVVSVEVVELDSALYLLSASTDHTARLWGLDGQPIGIFGQKKLWSLKQPAPSQTKPVQWKDTEVEGEEQTHKQTDIQTDTQADQQGQVEEQSTGELNKQEDKDRYGEGERETDLEIKRGTDIIGDFPEDGALPPICENQKVITAGSEDLDLTQSILGSQFKERMERVRKDKKDRRALETSLNLGLALRPASTQCCPYQAISLPVINNVHIPDNIPEVMTSFRANQDEELTSRDDVNKSSRDHRPANQRSRRITEGSVKSFKWKKNNIERTRLPSIASSRGE